MHAGTLTTIAMLLTALVPATALAAGLGDGSDTNNANLLVPGACPDCAFSAGPAETNPIWNYWNLGLRGAYVSNNDGSHFETLVLPSFGMGMSGGRRSYDLSAGAEFSKSTKEPARINYLWGAFNGSYKLDAATNFDGKLTLDVGQSSINAPWQEDDLANSSIGITLSGEGAVSRTLGRLTFSARGTGERAVFSADTLLDSTAVPMDHKNYWAAGGGLRVGYAMTPILGVFGDLYGSRQMFDRASPSLGLRQDNDTYVAKVGLTGKWENHLEIEGAVGLGLRRFADPGLAEVGSTQYEAKLTYTPNATLTMTAEAFYGLGDETVTSTQTTPIEAELLAGLAYKLNPTVTLRGAAGWNWAQKSGSADAEYEYAAGVGLDYIVNARTTLTADYTYTHGVREPNPPDIEHRAVVGVTFSK
jgi:hypothetical protein